MNPPRFRHTAPLDIDLSAFLERRPMPQEPDDLWGDRRRHADDDDTVGGDVRIGLAKLSERTRTMAYSMEEMNGTLKDIQLKLLDVLSSRAVSATDDKRFDAELEKTKAAVVELVSWRSSVVGSSKTFRWLISSIGGALMLAVGWLFTTFSSDHTDIASIKQQLHDHVQDDNRARHPEP